MLKQYREGKNTETPRIFRGRDAEVNLLINKIHESILSRYSCDSRKKKERAHWCRLTNIQFV